MTIIFQNFTVLGFFAFLHSLKKRKVCTPISTLKFQFFAIHIITKFKVKLLAIKFLTASLQEACKNSQIHVNPHAMCANLYLFLFLNNFLGERTLLQTIYFSISYFWYKLTQPNEQCRKPKKGLLKVHFFKDDCTYKNPAAGCRKHKLNEGWQTEGISCSFVFSLTNSLM